MKIKAPFFLATTALEEFWNVEMPILFLGEWCKKNSRRLFWEHLDYTVIRSSWYKKEQVYQARQYTKEIFDKMINLLSERFNYIHNEKHSKGYWKIVIGAWLRWYIDIMYIRYIHLMDVIDNYENFTTILLSPQCYVIPKDTFDFNVRLSQKDEYNLQIYTKIFQALGIHFPIKSLENQIIHDNNIKVNSIEKKFYKKHLHYLLYYFQNRGLLFLASSFFDRLEKLKFLLQTSGKVYPLIQNMKPPLSLNISQEKRSDLKAINLGNTEFEILLEKLLPFDVPLCYIEGYEIIKEFVKKNYPSEPVAIFSERSWYFEEEVKLWSAISKERGAILIGTQHGGNYGSVAYPFSAEFETDITDRYYTWGWEKKNCSAQVIPFYASKLIGRKKIGPSNSKEGILFATTEIFRYQMSIERYEYVIKKYLSWQQIFINNIDVKIKSMMRIRLHKNDRDFEMFHRWKDIAHDLLIEKWDIPFLSSLKNCRLFVCDHLSTTFAEALSSNKPSILFWDPESYDFEEDAVPYYDMLHDAGILHYSPEEAAEKINFVYHDVETWWNRSDLQKTLKIFTNKYAHTIDNGYNEWCKEFLRIIGSHKRRPGTVDI